ncbi:hypothetical protein ACRQU7_01465 [Caproiciproducens sp. R1]|uniref:hypothetical protein n=1 Tax=Caproiciproducens sp. R1 TaxID=3435000 RepID=UPI0040348746
MNIKSNVLRMDLYRIVTSAWFYFSIVLVTVLCFSCNWTDISQVFSQGNHNIDVTYIFTILMGLGEFKNMILIAAALACVGNFCSDWNHQFIRPVVIRCGARKYSHSKIFSCLISTFLTVFIGLLLFVFLLSLRIPLHQEGSFSSSLVLNKPYDYLINGDFPILYFIVKIFILSIACAFWGIVGLCVTSYIPNHFVAVASPFIAYYLLGEFGEYLPNFMNFRMLAYSYDVLGQGVVITAVYTILFFGVLSALAGRLFTKNVQRRVSSEML